MFIAQPARREDPERQRLNLTLLCRRGPETCHATPSSVALLPLTSSETSVSFTIKEFLAEVPLYHNGALVYRDEAVRSGGIYGLNGRRTNHARIADGGSIRVCSLQNIEESAKLIPMG